VKENSGMELELAGRTAFISGSTKGIGYSIAAALLREGAAVVVNGRDEASVKRAVSRLGDAVPGADVRGLAADFAETAAVDALIERLGGVDILVNNVGTFDVADFFAVTDEVWHRYFELNVMSGVRLSRRLLPGMLARNSGRILFIASESGVNVPADMIHYGATKAAMIALANGLAKLTRGTEVTVNTILGGPTFSDGVATAVGAIAEAQGVGAEEVASAVVAGNRTSLLQRFIRPEEIADLAVYLASGRSSATNGAAVRADGGVLTGLL
jgi:NAD(P)-dependent dehydrogenase (short-subunit alcohol dehydrogenase family)